MDRLSPSADGSIFEGTYVTHRIVVPRERLLEEAQRTAPGWSRLSAGEQESALWQVRDPELWAPWGAYHTRTCPGCTHSPGRFGGYPSNDGPRP